jgi:hypothetical protein
MTLGNQLEQIAIALFILDQQSKMAGGLMGWFSATAISLSDIDFAANDWFYTCFPSRHIKINDAIHGTVVSDSQAVHAQFLGSGNKLRYAAHAIEQAVFGVDVQMDKLLRHRLDYNTCTRGPERGISDYQTFLPVVMSMAIRLHLYLIPPQTLKLTIWCQRGLRPEAWMMGSGFVVNLGINAIRFANKKRSQR